MVTDCNGFHPWRWSLMGNWVRNSWPSASSEVGVLLRPTEPPKIFRPPCSTKHLIQHDKKLFA